MGEWESHLIDDSSTAAAGALLLLVLLPVVTGHPRRDDTLSRATTIKTRHSLPLQLKEERIKGDAEDRHHHEERQQIKDDREKSNRAGVAE